MKRGQMEMVGLVIIVILITLGMLFMAIFALKGDDTREGFVQKGLAASTMTALMKTTVQECGVPVALEKDLLEDCALGFGLPDDVYQYQCSGKNSCVFLGEKVNELLNSTLGQWGLRYEFESTLLTTGDKIVGPVTSGGGCPARKVNRDTSGPFYLSSQNGQVRSELFVC